MWLLLLPLLAQEPLERRILVAEHQRSDETSALSEGVQSSDPRLQRLAVRAIGRLERPGLSTLVLPLLNSPDSLVRTEAINALGQLRTVFDFGALASKEQSVMVRSVVYATAGRIPFVTGQTDRFLLGGLTDASVPVRRGAARGLESMYRLNPRNARPDTTAIAAMHRAFAANSDATMREYLLTTLSSAGDRDSATFDIARSDPDPQVRRLGVIGSRPRADDPPGTGRMEAMILALSDSSPMVRFEALKIAGDCDIAKEMVSDYSGHVSLAAVDMLGNRRCEPAFVLNLLENSPDWRIRAHALEALARTAPEAMRARIGKYVDDPNWRLRMYVGGAAKIIRDQPTLARLAMDPDPNVATEALSTSAEAIHWLSSSHNGLLLASAKLLRGKPELAGATPQILATLLRLNRNPAAIRKDVKAELLERLREAGSPATIAALRPLLSDVDPVIASLTAAIMSQKSGTKVNPVTTKYQFAALPSDAYLRGLIGATATFTMKDLGSFTVELLMDEAPASASTFAQLAESGAYNGRDFHRVVPNFLIQGGSPGADEYDGPSTTFMPEEVGLSWHTRGTMGTSTGGHDTGDGQMYINTIDNYRLDNSYTIYGRVIKGMDIVDRVLEDAVIESVKIVRKNAAN